MAYIPKQIGDTSYFYQIPVSDIHTMDANYMPHFEINKMYVTSSEVEFESEIVKIY